MADVETTKRAKKAKPGSDDVLPIEVASEDDATEDLLGLPLKEGHNLVARSRSGLELMVRARTGAPFEYVIIDSQGRPVDQTIQIRATSASAKTTTCWECGVDEQGNTHCWKIPCPIIVGPWEPGKVLSPGYVLA